MDANFGDVRHQRVGGTAADIKVSSPSYEMCRHEREKSKTWIHFSVFNATKMTTKRRFCDADIEIKGPCKINIELHMILQIECYMIQETETEFL